MNLTIAILILKKLYSILLLNHINFHVQKNLADWPISEAMRKSELDNKGLEGGAQVQDTPLAVTGDTQKITDAI